MCVCVGGGVAYYKLQFLALLTRTTKTSKYNLFKSTKFVVPDLLYWICPFIFDKRLMVAVSIGPYGFCDSADPG